jgi:hypothetical protein
LIGVKITGCPVFQKGIYTPAARGRLFSLTHSSIEINSKREVHPDGTTHRRIESDVIIEEPKSHSIPHEPCVTVSMLFLGTASGQNEIQ